MGYMHIDNLYKNQDVLRFKECYALEKIHGTSAHVSCKDGVLHFFSGGSNYEQFVALFKDLQPFPCDATIYGEAYGGKLQGMSETYGKQLRFVAFDVKIGDSWQPVPNAEQFCEAVGIEFVHYELVSTDIESLNAQRDADSAQATRNGMGPGHMREGVVLRPLIEVIKNNGKRIIAKHKRFEFSETRTKREVTPEKLAVLAGAKAIAEEWVTPMRLSHITHAPSLENLGNIIPAMIEDIRRESHGEVIWTKDVEKAIGRATASLVRSHLTL